MADWQEVKDELKRRGFKDIYDEGATEEEKAASRAETDRLIVELCPPFPFDAVMSDLLMPASRKTMGDKGMKFVGQEMPVGFALALMAARHAKYVAVVTATNHHDHPASAMLDSFRSRVDGKAPCFVINGAKVGFYQEESTFVDGTSCTDCNGTGEKETCYCIEQNDGSVKPDCDNCHGRGRYCWKCRSTGKKRGKDWGGVLAHLTA